MRIDRLEMLKRALQDAIDLRVTLNMESWADSDGLYNIWEFDLFKDPASPQMDEMHACGTTCCIAGWGGCSSELQKEGLSLVLAPTKAMHLTLYGERGVEIAEGESAYSQNSLQSFFDISPLQAQALFSSDYSIQGKGEVLQAAISKYRGVGDMTLAKGIDIIDNLIAKALRNEH